MFQFQHRNLEQRHEQWEINERKKLEILKNTPNLNNDLLIYETLKFEAELSKRIKKNILYSFEKLLKSKNQSLSLNPWDIKRCGTNIIKFNINIQEKIGYNNGFIDWEDSKKYKNIIEFAAKELGYKANYQKKKFRPTDIHTSVYITLRKIPITKK